MVSNAARIAERKNRPRKTEDVTLPAGDVVRLRVLTLLDRDDHNLAVLNGDGKLDPDKMRGHKARLVAKCIVDENGQTYASWGDVIEAYDVDEIDLLHSHCERINNIGRKAVEEAAGNS